MNRAKEQGPPAAAPAAAGGGKQGSAAAASAKIDLRDRHLIGVIGDQVSGLPA